MSGEPAKEVVIVIRADLDLPDDLSPVVAELVARMNEVPKVKQTWGWVGIDNAAQAVLTDVDRSPRWAPDGGRTIERAIEAAANSSREEEYRRTKGSKR
jgi:hypothetical protein